MLKANQRVSIPYSPLVQSKNIRRKAMKKLNSTYWRVLYLLLTIIALVLAVGAPESIGW